MYGRSNDVIETSFYEETRTFNSESQIFRHVWPCHSSLAKIYIKLIAHFCRKRVLRVMRFLLLQGKIYHKQAGSTVFSLIRIIIALTISIIHNHQSKYTFSTKTFLHQLSISYFVSKFIQFMKDERKGIPGRGNDSLFLTGRIKNKRGL